MNCKICGAELSKPGELCNNCMNRLLKEQERKNDKSEIITVKGSFIALYEIVKNFDKIGVAIFIIAILFWIKYWQLALAMSAIFLILGGLLLLRRRLVIRTTSWTIYTTKVVIKRGLLRRKTTVVPLEEIDYIGALNNPTSFQKALNIGTIGIRKKTYNLLNKFETIESIKNVDDVDRQIKEGLGIQEKPVQ